MSSALHAAAILADAPAAESSRFIVGQDARGHWVAIEIHGRAGGYFRSCQAAVEYAEDETSHRLDAVLVSADPVELRV